MFKSMFLLFAALVAVTSASESLRGSDRELTFFGGGCSYSCPANSYFATSWHRSLTFFIAPKCGSSWSWWSKSSCPCSFDDCVCSPGFVKQGWECVYPAKPVPKPVPAPVAKPVPAPVAKPVPAPVAKPVPAPVEYKPVPAPVAKPTPMPVVKPTPMPVVKPTPMPVVKPTPMPVVKPTPMPVVKPTPMPVAKPVAKPTPMPFGKPYCQLKAIGGCDSCVCPPGTHVGAHVQCLDTLQDCFCDDTNDNADRNPRCIRNY